MNNIIQQVFQHANYSQEELPLMESFSFDEVTKAFEKAEKLVQSMVTEDHSEGDEGRVAVLPQEDEEPAKEKEGEEPEEGAEPEEETDGEEEQADSGEVQEKEVEDSASGKQFKLPKMSDEEIMKSIKGLSDVVNGVDIEDEEDN